jgi:hypothetical protein
MVDLERVIIILLGFGCAPEEDLDQGVDHFPLQTGEQRIPRY